MERLLLPMGPHPTIHEETVDSRASAIITKTFEYKIRATREFVEAAERALDASRFVYNCALEQRIMRYRQGKPIGYIEQSKELTEARTQPDVGDVLRNIQQDALERLDAAFLAFFKRVKKGEMPGFPRFKGRSRYRTFSQKIEKQRGCPLDGDRLAIDSEMIAHGRQIILKSRLALAVAAIVSYITMRSGSRSKASFGERRNMDGITWAE